MRYWYNSFFKSLGVLFVLAVLLVVIAFTDAKAVEVSLGLKTQQLTLTYYLPDDRAAACVTAGLLQAAQGLTLSADGSREAVTVLQAARAGLMACQLPADELTTVSKLPEWLAATAAGFTQMTETGDPCEFVASWQKAGVEVCAPSPESDE